MNGLWKHLFGKSGRKHDRTHRHHTAFPLSLQTLLAERETLLQGITALVTGSGTVAHDLAKRRIDVTLGRPCHHSIGYPGVTYIARPRDWNAGRIDLMIVDTAEALEDAGACYSSLSPRAVVILLGNDAQYPRESALLTAFRAEQWRQLPFRDGAETPPARLWYRDGNFLGI